MGENMRKALLVLCATFSASLAAQSTVDKTDWKSEFVPFQPNGKTTATKLNADWVFVAASNDVSLHYNKRTIVRTSQFTKAWLIYNYTNNSLGRPHRSVKQLVYLKCKERTSAIAMKLTYAEENGEGRAVESRKVDVPEYSDVVPDTFGEQILDLLCQNAGTSKLSNRSPASESSPPRSTVSPDREQQDVTGYIDSERQSVQAGLSSFTVDNTSGAGDAIVRIYVDGKKPAARSFFVKHGETFTAEKLKSGNYAMRYRYMGSEDTYEANKMFRLSEVKEADGVKFSKVRVTLYKVRDGNLTTKKVDPSTF